MSRSHPARGFTIVELMVVLAIAGVMLGFALPAFNGFITQRNMTTNINDFVLAINYARSEAARLGQNVTVQAANAGDNTNEWGAGYCVVQGNPGNCNGTVLRRFDPIDDATLNATGGLNGLGQLTFNSRGMFLGAVAGSVQLCGGNNDDDPGREVTLNIIGRASTNELDCF